MYKSPDPPKLAFHYLAFYYNSSLLHGHVLPQPFKGAAPNPSKVLPQTH